MRAGKRIYVVFFAVLAAFSALLPAALALTVLKENLPEKERPVSLKDIYLPEELKNGGFGLYWLDCSGKKYKSTDQKGLSGFDREKPVIVYFHGFPAAEDTDIEILEKWLDKGYNAAVFDWSALSDEAKEEYAGQKIWGTDGKKKMRYKKSGGDYEEADTPNAPVAEIFAAYYLDFMRGLGGYSGGEIRFAGCEAGARLAYAAASYLITKEQAGVITADFLPDRIAASLTVTPLMVYDVNVSWLNKKMSAPQKGQNGLTADTEFLAETAAALSDRGIILETLYYGEAEDTLTEAAYQSLFAEACALRYSGAIEEFKYYYLNSLQYAPPVDAAMENSRDLSFSALTPSSYVLGRRGAEYAMRPEEDGYTCYSLNIAAPYAAGFVFNDLNGNGVYDDRIRSRLEGVRVEAYLKSGAEERLLGSSLTGKSGFYKIEIPTIYANGFDTLYIKAVYGGGYGITRRAERLEMLNNDINPYDDTSDLFILDHRRTLKILNAGLYRK